MSDTNSPIITPPTNATPALVGVAFVGGVIMGLLVSLITAAILKNAKPEFE